MKLLVGLGNPGPRYELTRHNAGFLMLDQIIDRNGGVWSGQKFSGLCGKATVLGVSVTAIKPQTFMNLSGRSVAEAMRFYKVTPKDLIVLHDDIDVPSGKVKAREGGGHGGHNGIRSIIECLGTGDFHRIKLGVGRPDAASRQDVHNWVLGPMTQEELDTLAGVMVDEVLVRLQPILSL